MGIRNFQFLHDGHAHPAALAALGPILQVELHVPSALATVMGNTGQTIPGPVTGWGVIDTGATRSAIHREAADQLGVQPVGVVTSGTAGGQQQHELFPVRIVLSGVPFDVEFASAAGVDLTGQEAEGRPIVALIGRDVLGICVFTYNGPGGFFTLAW